MSGIVFFFKRTKLLPILLLTGWMIAVPEFGRALTSSLVSYGSLINQSSGLALADPGSSASGGTHLIQWHANGFPDQGWYAELQPNGFYLLANASSGLYLRASGSTAGSLVEQALVSGADDQLWMVTPNGSGFLLQSKANGLYLDNSASTVEGQQVTLAARTGGASQTWLNNNYASTLNTSSTKYRISNAASGLALADPASSSRAGTAMITWSGNGYADQLWCLCGSLAGGVTIQNTSSGLYLTDTGTTSGLPAVQEPYTGAASQAWLVSQSGAGYVLQNLGTGRVIQGGTAKSPGQQTTLGQQNGAATQLWSVSASSSLADGFYTLTNRASGLLLADPDSGLQSGTAMIQWVANSYRDQSWHIVPRGNGYYTIRNQASGQLLGDINTPELEQQASGIDDAHLWYLTAGTAGGLTIQNKSTGRAIDVGSGTQKGALVVLGTPSGGATQDWLLASTVSNVVPSGTYKIVSGQTNQVLADPASSTAPGTQIVQYVGNGLTDQQWNIKAMTGGFYTIQNVSSQLYLTAPASSSGGALVQQPSDGGNDQLWTLSPTDGPLTISNRATGQVVQVSNSSQGSGVVVVPSTSAPSQSWSLAYVVVNSFPMVSQTAYSFGANVIGNPLKQTVATITNPASNTTAISLALLGDSSYSIDAADSCGSQLAGGASCSVIVQYLPTTSGTQMGTVELGFGGDVTAAAAVALSGTSMPLPSGSVAATIHPLVAQYSVIPGSNATVTVEFGTDTSYGRTTSATTVTGTNPVNVFVAGMRAKTLYHMRATIAYANGQTLQTADRTFMTGSPSSDLASLNLAVTTTPGFTPQPGVELLDPVNIGTPRPYALDLQGNLIWYYPWSDYNVNDQIDGFKQMTNGDYIAVVGVLSSEPLTAVPSGTPIEIREINLIGNVVRRLTLADLNARLSTAGYSFSLVDFHHDIAVLPNGHWLILANTIKNVGGTNILGDVVVDVDLNSNPMFVWNEFDHFDTNRRPMGFPDWTHSNAVVYSPEDGNFLVSMRHQHWVVKVNYQNGAGDGSVLWRLGAQGDFTLKNGTDPIDWQYAQHYPSFTGPNSSGMFSLTLMDNGDNRPVAGGACGTATAAACYTTVPIFQINETARTATIEWRHTLPSSLYSFFAGNAEVLANGNVEYDLCGLTASSEIDEVTQDTNQTLVWSLKTTGNQQYRAFRIPSLYPGVQW